MTKHERQLSLHRLTAFLAGVVLLLTGCGAPASNAISYNRAMQTKAQSLAVRSNRVIVKFRASATEQQVKSVSRFVAASIPSLGISVLNVGTKDASTQLAALASTGAVEYSEPDYVAKTQVSTNDPGLGQQYGHRALNVPRAWDVTMGDPSVVVAVVDTGIDLNHPDLRDRLVSGVSFVPGTAGPMDDNGHGTHVAGIIAATGNNGQGVVGVAPNCRLMPVKVLDTNGEGNTSDIVSGIVWAAEHGARVINLSLGGGGGGKALESAVAYAQRKGCVVVAAMGNDGSNLQAYPASYPGVIAVGSVDEGDTRSDFSNFGRWISVTAPGGEIYSTMPTYRTTLMDQDPGADIGYGTLSGTSMATPYVAGLVALICSANPRIAPAAVKNLLERTATDLQTPGYDSFTGYGRVDAARALGR